MIWISMRSSPMGLLYPCHRGLPQQSSTGASMSSGPVAVASRSDSRKLCITANGSQSDCLVQMGQHCLDQPRRDYVGVAESPLFFSRW